MMLEGGAYFYECMNFFLQQTLKLQKIIKVGGRDHPPCPPSISVSV